MCAAIAKVAVPTRVRVRRSVAQLLPGRGLAPARYLVVGACATAVFRCTLELSFLGVPGRHSSEPAPPQTRRSLMLGGMVAGPLLSFFPQASLALTAKELAVVDMFRKTSPSVLSISDAAGSEENKKDMVIVASGFAWDQNHVVTTASSLKGVSKPRITVIDREDDGTERRRVYTGAIVGTDLVSDVAVLWIDGDMTPLHRGSSEDLRVGQEVFALGNPFGFEHSLSKGVVSGVSRTMMGITGRPIMGVIQTDASINPGNNGGPLLDSTGAVVGVNNAILSTSGTFGGIGLAIPIEAIERSVTGVIIEGHVRTPSMGVVLAEDSLSQELGFDGVMVRQVEAGGPAALAGVKPMRSGHLGDVIIGIDSKPVDSLQAFFQALDGKMPGEAVTLSVRRAMEDENSDNLQDLTLEVQLGAKIIA